MKRLHLKHISSGGKPFFFFMSKTEFTLLMLTTVFALLTWAFCASVQAAPLPEKLSLLKPPTDEFRPELLEHKSLYQTLQRSAQKPHVSYLAKQTDLELNNILRGLAKSAKINITPQVVMKPFFLVQEVKNALYVFQTRRLKKQIRIDRNFQAKASYNAKEISFMQEVKKTKPLLLSACENRIYGIHIQINFK